MRAEHQLAPIPSIRHEDGSVVLRDCYSLIVPYPTVELLHLSSMGKRSVVQHA